MNDHPEELLAEYVEGSLDPDERARTEAHIATCEQCQEEVQLATASRAALASLPDLEVPPGLQLAVRRETRGAPSRTLRWVGAVAAAAAIVAGGVIVLGNLGGQDSPGTGGGDAATQEQSRAEEAPAASGAGGVAADQAEPTLAEAFAKPIVPDYLETERDYKPAQLVSLARRLRDDARLALEAGLAPRARDFYSSFDPSAFTPDIRQAIRCVLAEVPPTQLIVPFRIEAASFEGEPAYIAAFLQGPSPDEPYDRIVMWVVDRAECSLLSLASQVL